MDIRPFQGWRYNAPGGDVSGLIAPPYDILKPPDRQALLAGDERNIVAVDLPHCPASDLGPPEAYDRAARTLKDWQAGGVLVRDARPCLYAYQQTFTWAGRQFRRRALIAAVRLQPFGQGVWPHEKTFAGPKADRLRLMQETRTQLSPILGFYEDQPGAGDRDAAGVAGVSPAIKGGGFPPADPLPAPHQPGATDTLFSAAARTPPACHGKLGDVREDLWAVSDPAAIEAVRSHLPGRDLFIADGHHRYTTALNYRDSLGQLPPDHPANYVMFVLVAMNDPGLIILPTHRVFTGLAGFDLERFTAAGQDALDFRKVRPSRTHFADAEGYLAGFGPHAMLLAAPQDGGLAAYVARPRDLGVMDRLAAQEHPAWRQLDVSILHRLVIEQHLKPFMTDRTKIEYFADGLAALSAVQEARADLAVFLRATPLSAVKEVALAGAVMPHKSTYFYPKPATGLVIYPLE